MRYFLLLLYPIVLISSFLLNWGMVQAADEGIDYAVIEPAQPTTAPADKIEVLELFWYGCPHCFMLEPKLNQWLAKKPADVIFMRMPAAVNPNWALHAKIYYVAQELEVLDKIHTPLFDAIHNQHRKLDSLAALADFFAEQGVNKEIFYKTFNHSFFVHTQSQRSAIMPDRYGITGVPTLIVDGRYRLNAQMAGGSNENMLKILDEVLAKVRQNRASAAAAPASPVTPVATPPVESSPSTPSNASPTP